MIGGFNVSIARGTRNSQNIHSMKREIQPERKNFGDTKNCTDFSRCGLLNLGKMTKRKKRKEQPVTFAEVEGVDAAKAEILKVICVEMVTLNLKMGKTRNLCQKCPKGFCLRVPPGTGKMLLAHALAFGVSFHVANSTEFVEIVVGRGASPVTEPF
nr:ATPase, AAA-type, core, P-loop containing nucleoside triphosphate hydrolase [Tanacetum cinerariifolium]